MNIDKSIIFLFLMQLYFFDCKDILLIDIFCKNKECVLLLNELANLSYRPIDKRIAQYGTKQKHMMFKEAYYCFINRVIKRAESKFRYLYIKNLSEPLQEIAQYAFFFVFAKKKICHYLRGEESDKNIREEIYYKLYRNRARSVSEETDWLLACAQAWKTHGIFYTIDFLINNFSRLELPSFYKEFFKKINKNQIAKEYCEIIINSWLAQGLIPGGVNIAIDMEKAIIANFDFKFAMEILYRRKSLLFYRVNRLLNVLKFSLKTTCTIGVCLFCISLYIAIKTELRQ